MGAAASIEMQKPLDASDIRSSGSLPFASSEVIRLRADLGHLAKLAGINIVVYDASDILLGDDGDFERCVKEVAHIRQCLQLHTQSSRRKTRMYSNENLAVADTTPSGDHHDESSSSSDDDE